VIGDSIAHNGAWHNYVYLYYVTRFPTQRFSLLNCGISGDNAGRGVMRLGWDILPAAPTVATLLFGMNDVARHLYDAGQDGPEVARERAACIATCVENLRTLATALRDAGSAVIFLSPTIYDQTVLTELSAAVGVNEALAEVAARVGELAASFGAPCLDWQTPLQRLTREGQARDPYFSLLNPDRVHPHAAGHFIMAHTLLAAQGLPRSVAGLGIDAAERTVTTEDNCRISALAVADGALHFDCLEAALPFPVEPAAQPALALVPFTETLNQETLRVTGLRAGRYTLRIDDTVIAEYTAETLAAGVNLATEPATPQYRQALAVQALNTARHDLIRERLRAFIFVEWHCTEGRGVAHDGPLSRARLAELAANDAGYIGDQYRVYLTEKANEAAITREVTALTDRLWAAAPPTSHHFDLQPS
jgi:lysophospholipase L1-like esterase